MIERVARAMVDNVYGLDETDVEAAICDNSAGLDFRSLAAAAIEAMREPSDKMIVDGAHEIFSAETGDPIPPWRLADAYRAMIDGAFE